MRRIILVLAAISMVAVFVPAGAATCSPGSPDDNNRQQCAPQGCTLTQTTPCRVTRQIVGMAGGTYSAGAELGSGNVNDPNTFIGYCKNNAVQTQGQACQLITPAQAQALASSEAACLQAFDPTDTPWTKCIPNEPDPNKHNVGSWAAVRRANIARAARCAYLADDAGAVAQPNRQGKVGYVFEQQIPAGGPRSGAISWVGRYFKLTSADPSADFDLYFYTYLGQALCANEVTTTGTQPEQPTGDADRSTFSKPGNESGLIPPCTNQDPMTSACLGADSAAVVDGQAWYSVIVTMFTGKPMQNFTLTICPTSSPC